MKRLVVLLVAIALLGAACTSSTAPEAVSDAPFVHRGYLPIEDLIPKPVWFSEEHTLRDEPAFQYACHEVSRFGPSVDTSWSFRPIPDPSILINEYDFDATTMHYDFRIMEPATADTEADFTALVDQFDSCENYVGHDEERGSIDGIQTGTMTTLDGLADEAVQFEAIFGLGWVVGHGHITVIRDGATNMVGVNMRVTRDWMFDELWELDDFAAGDDSGTVPGVYRELLDTRTFTTDVQFSGEERDADGGTYHVVTNNGTLPAHWAISDDEGIRQRSFPDDPLEPGESAITRIDESEPVEDLTAVSLTITN